MQTAAGTVQTPAMGPVDANGYPTPMQGGRRGGLRKGQRVTVKQLKSALKAKGKPVSGKKATLRARAKRHHIKV